MLINRFIGWASGGAAHLPAGLLRTRLARRAAARSDPRSIAAAGGDPVVLARLGLHYAALEALETYSGAAGDRALRVARAQALAATGAVEASLAILAAAKDFSDADRRFVLRAIAPVDPHAALALAAGESPEMRAALALAAGFPGLATKLLRAAPPSVEVLFLRAAAATYGNDRKAARAAINAAFTGGGLAAPLEVADAPVTLTSFGAGMERRSVPGPLISVVIPMHQASDTIEASVRSILCQTWSALELLIVDDRSTDDGRDIAEGLAKQDSRIRISTNARSPGAAGARNTGIAEAAGDFVMLHDADDWAHPSRIERQMQAMRGAHGSVSSHVRLDDRGHLLAPRVTPFVRISPACLLVRREALDRVGPVDEAPAGSDSEYLARLDHRIGRGRIRRCADVLTIASWRRDSISGHPASGLLTGEGGRSREAYRHSWLRRLNS